MPKRHGQVYDNERNNAELYKTYVSEQEVFDRWNSNTTFDDNEQYGRRWGDLATAGAPRSARS